MSASTDPHRARSHHAGPRGLLDAAWRPAGLVYLACCLAGLLAGLYPQAVYPARSAVTAAPLPALRTLAVAQALFILLAQPLIALRRAERGLARRYWAETILESATWLVATVPFYTAAAYLGDATAVDVLRTAVYLACLWPVAWAAGALLARRGAARAPVGLLLLVAAALPGVHYLFREFLPVYRAAWLWQLAPATAAWDAAASRAGTLLPRPLWSLAAWPAVALALLAGSVLGKQPR